MLNRAGFSTPDSDTNLAFGIHADATAMSFPAILGNTNAWPDVNFVSDNTNDFLVFNSFGMEKTNGLLRFTIPAGDTNDAYGAFINCLIQIGIKVQWLYKPDWVSPNHCAVYIHQKPQ
jgi:hypothetical protein